MSPAMGYTEIKDSGHPCIGLIPAHWTLSRFGRIASVKSNLVEPSSYMSYPQISPENIEKDSGVLLDWGTVEQSGVVSWNHLFFQGQIIYSKVRPALNKVVIAPFDGLCSADMYPIDTEHHSRFVMYLMLSQCFVEQVAMVTGNRVKMPKINQAELSEIIVAVPPIDEEIKIAEYLDKRCAEIDEIIAETKASIEDYKQWKASVIYEAVTKGLNPNAEMKESGVEWIGDIPTGFTATKIKSLSTRISVGVVIRPSDYFDENGNVPFLRGLNIKEFDISEDNMIHTNERYNAQLSKSIIHTNDILIVRDGSIGTSCVVPEKYDGANVVSLIIVTPNQNTDSKYLCYCLNSFLCKRQFELTKIGSALSHTSVSAVSNIYVTIPDCFEQKRIADYLDLQCEKIDSLIYEKENLISDLEAYKKSLIYEAVTGKRKVV